MDKVPAGTTARFGKYVLLDRIGRGGMSEVFLAKTEGIEGFERKVALKRIFSSLTAHPEFVQSFIYEAKIGGMLYHHNVVQTLDFGRVQDSYFIALEYIEGTHLGAVLARARDQGKPIPPAVFMQIALQICEGLEYIHSASIEGADLRLVHRDIKPSNMLLGSQGLVKISDFGVVKATAQAGDRTAVGSVKGTIGYMSPEQARGDEVGPSSDLFSFGALLFEMATLRRLYGEGDELAILARVRDSVFQVPIETAGLYIPGLERVLKRLLAHDPRDRYPSAAQAAAALRALPVVVADRSALVSYVRSLGLLEPRTSGAQNTIRETPREQLRDLVRDPTPAPVPALQVEEPLLPHPPAPTFASVRAANNRWAQVRSVLVALGALLLGAAGGVGAYWLVDSTLGQRQAMSRPITPTVVHAAPEQSPGQTVQVFLQTVPPGAEVLINGTLVASSPAQVTVAPGQRVGVRLDGYRPWDRTVDENPGSSGQQWIVTLKPQ